MLIDGLPVTTAQISSILRTVKNKDGETTNSASVATSAVYDSLQLGAGWNADGIGWNFRDTIPATAFSAEPSWYRISYIFTPVSGSQFPLISNHTTVAP